MRAADDHWQGVVEAAATATATLLRRSWPSGTLGPLLRLLSNSTHPSRQTKGRVRGIVGIWRHPSNQRQQPPVAG